MIVLVDMDGVIVEFEEGLIEEIKSKYPSMEIIEKEKRDKLIKNFYSGEERKIIDEIRHSPKFIRNLKPSKGAIEALKSIKEKGHEIFICTSPMSKNDNCLQEKYDWILEHLGEDWKKRIIITKDKTLVKGDILIDDSPEIKGIQAPSWEHILFDQPYNQKVENKRRINWENYSEIIEI